MDFAIDRNRRRVAAADADAGQSYVCPVCAVPVTLIRAKLQRIHFRHSPRTPLEWEREQNCCQYVPDFGGGAPHDDFDQPWAEDGHVGLCVVLTTDSQGERWALCLAPPKPPQVVRSVLVKGDINANGGVQEYPAERLRSRTKLTVRIASSRYSVTGRGAGTQVIWQPESPPFLSESSPNVFRFGTTVGQFLGPEDDLVADMMYFALCKKERWVAPPHDYSRSVDVLPACDPTHVWCGHLVYVPSQGDREFDQWRISFLDRRVTERQSEISLITPPAPRSRVDELIEVPAGEDVAFALTGSNWTSPYLEIVEESSGEAKSWDLGYKTRFFSVGALSPGTYTVYVREAADFASIRLSCVVAETVAPRGIVLRTTTGSGESQAREVALHDAECGNLWASLMTGDAELADLEVPSGWPVSVTWKSAAEHEEIRTGLTSSQSLKSAILECVAAQPVRSEISAGVFGYAAFSKTIPQASTTRPGRRLPTGHGARLRWVMLALQSDRDRAEGQIIRPARAYDRHTPVPRFVAEFDAVEQWPLSLLAHARSVRHGLDKHFSP